MTEMSLKEIQIETLNILKEIDEICSIIGVKYYLIYGSLLGAIRHKGFIPWDDDIDIAMPIDDYKRFENYIIVNGNKHGLEIHNQKTNKDCFYNISRICEKEHRLLFDGMDYQSGLFVDIYVLEGIGTEEDLIYWRQRFAHYNKWRKGVYCSAQKSFLYGNGILHQIMNIPIVIYSKIRGKKYYIDKFNTHNQFEISGSQYLGIPAWENDIYSITDFAEIIRVPFENITVNIPSGYARILQDAYGDYLKLPPESERHPHHGFKAYKR